MILVKMMEFWPFRGVVAGEMEVPRGCRVVIVVYLRGLSGLFVLVVGFAGKLWRNLYGFAAKSDVWRGGEGLLWVLAVVENDMILIDFESKLWNFSSFGGSWRVKWMYLGGVEWL